MTPCSVRIMPSPVGIGEAKTRSMPSMDSPNAHPTISTRQSRSPNSWNVTSSMSLP